MKGIIHITTTSDNKESLEKIARGLLEDRLASCVQILGPMKSLYWWKEKITESDEWLGIIKTRKDLYKRVEERIKEQHHYELPEIIAFEADNGLPAYGNWVLAETEYPTGEGR